MPGYRSPENVATARVVVGFALIIAAMVYVVRPALEWCFSVLRGMGPEVRVLWAVLVVAGTILLVRWALDKTGA